MSISQVDEEIKRRKMDPDFSSVYINHRSFKAINTIQRGFKVGEMSVIARGVIFSGFCQNLVIFYSNIQGGFAKMSDLEGQNVKKRSF